MTNTTTHIDQPRTHWIVNEHELGLDHGVVDSTHLHATGKGLSVSTFDPRDADTLPHASASIHGVRAVRCSAQVLSTGEHAFTLYITNHDGVQLAVSLFGGDHLLPMTREALSEV
jgi:hypothetical protein